jgi:hypothetical protein
MNRMKHFHLQFFDHLFSYSTSLYFTDVEQYINTASYTYTQKEVKKKKKNVEETTTITTITTSTAFLFFLFLLLSKSGVAVDHNQFTEFL